MRLRNRAKRRPMNGRRKGSAAKIDRISLDHLLARAGKDQLGRRGREKRPERRCTALALKLSAFTVSQPLLTFPTRGHCRLPASNTPRCLPPLLLSILLLRFHCSVVFQRHY
jgi:hypothetical protein